jgi:hypothetical protein
MENGDIEGCIGMCWRSNGEAVGDEFGSVLGDFEV